MDYIPQAHVAGMSDEYLTGYVQSLVDMHYFEFRVRTLVRHGVVYVFNLPKSDLIACSILSFIYDIPCITAVQRIDCTPAEFVCSVMQIDEQAAEEIASSETYQQICCALPRPQIQAIWLPQNTVLFQPLIADPRQVINAASLRFNDDVIGKNVGAVSFGGDYIFIRFKDILRWRGDMDLGIQAGIFAVFDLDHPEACLVNTDFFVAGLCTYAYGGWSYRFRLWHLSSHLGDEFLICNPGFDRRNLSDNGVDFFASYQWGRALRIYGGIGYTYYRDKEFPEDPVYLEAGSEIRVFGGKDCFNKLYIQPFLAMHFRSWQEHDFDIDQTYALGVEWSKIQGIGRKVRIFLEYHSGYSKEGQFVKERADYAAIKMEYGF